MATIIPSVRQILLFHLSVSLPQMIPTIPNTESTLSSLLLFLSSSDPFCCIIHLKVGECVNCWWNIYTSHHREAGGNPEDCLYVNENYINPLTVLLLQDWCEEAVMLIRLWFTEGLSWLSDDASCLMDHSIWVLMAVGLGMQVKRS